MSGEPGGDQPVAGAARPAAAGAGLGRRLLVVDNYDSFTYNLVQLLLVEGAEVEVLRNDAESAAAMLARRPDGILLSPGPGRPEEAGVCLELLALRPPLPVLGVCLGHQAMGVSFGGTVGRAAHLMHGKTSRVRHSGTGLFAGVSDPFEATRYHSLDVQEATLPPELEPVAWADDGTLMAMRHVDLPWWGVQFHPESVLTVEGPRLVRNFLALCVAGGGEGAGELPPFGNEARAVGGTGSSAEGAALVSARDGAPPTDDPTQRESSR